MYQKTCSRENYSLILYQCVVLNVKIDPTVYFLVNLVCGKCMTLRNCVQQYVHMTRSMMASQPYTTMLQTLGSSSLHETKINV